MATVVFPADELNHAVEAVVRSMQQHKKETYEVIGTALLTQIKLAYIDKASGGTGDDGISWAPLKVGTILARLRKAGHLTARGVKEEDRKLSGLAKKSFAVPSKNASGTVRNNRQRSIYTVARSVKKNKELFNLLGQAGVTFYDSKGHKATSSSDLTKKGTVMSVTSKVRKKEVTIAPGSYEIGVDTGLQRSSANPGFKGPDGLGNVFEQDEVSITVGFGRSYSTHFDKRRKLIPETLPDAWLKELEDLAAERGAKIIEDTLRDEGVS